jgi:DNA repair exonuclease SbcCD ATPase subunit
LHSKLEAVAGGSSRRQQQEAGKLEIHFLKRFNQERLPFLLPCSIFLILQQIKKISNMKKYFLFLLIPFFFACGREARKQAEALQARNDSLMAQTMQKDEAINEFIASINDIQGSLDTIKMKENIINLSTDRGSELKLSAKEQIKSDIQTIYSLMQKNKETLASLSKKLKNSTLKIDQLQKMVTRLEKELADKTAEIENLRARLAKLNADFEQANLKIDDLSGQVRTQGQQIQDQTKTIETQDEELNTAYYIIGNAKELKKNGVVKSGDILADFNKELFTKIDVRKVTEISILSKKAKLLSSHPSNSYKFSGDKKVIQALQILDYKSFWSSSRYLVIQVD